MGVVLLHLISYLLLHREDKMHIVDDGAQGFTGVSDASHANCPQTSRSWFGFCLMACDIAFSFRSKLQPYTAPSTRDAEIGGLVYCVKAMIATLVLLYELGFAQADIVPLTVESDNTAALAGMDTEWLHRDGRWNSIRVRFLRDFVRSGLIKGVFTKTDKMRANCLTKVPASGREHERERAELMGRPPNG